MGVITAILGLLMPYILIALMFFLAFRWFKQQITKLILKLKEIFGMAGEKAKKAKEYIKKKGF